MISSNELESARAGGDEIEAKFEGASLGSKISLVKIWDVKFQFPT